ncbi:Receptor-type guanylate cyclase gcy [Seminavis robusta]|uniref:Receptor-type guanylate cyclase gcy n=1 Tax=Seminavis robusta TaxID=568900 RepID=A0A9N8HLS5_9STRA|nr:Receptor-type guanylate cyclase gcy [Seminavis robusta]|eukprot:Sro836_g208940.1 Receptor-type guanylate cyclase gcy (780) ;mRNA; f:2730-5507
MEDKNFANGIDLAEHQNTATAEESQVPDEESEEMTNGDTVSQATAHDLSKIKKHATRTWKIALLMVVMGATASGIFLYFGISVAQNEQRESFERRASDFSKEIDGAWDDYEAAARSTHLECRNWRTDNLTHQDFEALYYYLLEGGLNFYSINWVPNITHAERPLVEEKEGAYWKNNVEGAENYAGFTGQEPDPDHPGELIYANRSEQDFYFPLYFVEPKSAAASIIHYDLFSAPWESPAISQALATYQPALTGRFVLAQHTPEDGYSTLLYHPGVKLPSHLEQDRHDLALIIMTLNPFLQHAARVQQEPMAVYLYDKTLAEMDEEVPFEFLGGVQVKYGNEDRSRRQVTNLMETEYATLQGSSDLYYERDIHAGGRTWAIVVIPVEGDTSYQPDVIFPILCGAMIFAASLLLAWIWVMHNRSRTQQVMEIVDKAAVESKIVSNLYPSAVREDMIRQQKESREAANKEKATAKAFNDEFLLQDGKHFTMLDHSDHGDKTIEGIYKTKPIAHHYEASTIMFADLAGFTSWSSSRSPEDVFTLLETLYGAFDEIARRRRVFKVETIGDCYVAVAGVPKPREDHAVVMCRFANDCLHKMQKLTKVLAEGSLGSDTSSLSFRVGLHSGPVTAGVLRGDKGRFQLFGDTMNTASRMESTGVKNKIQVSQEAADILVAKGYQKWLTPREDPVHAKGKGTLQTYFVTIASDSTASAQSSNGLSGNGTFELPLAPAIASEDTNTNSIAQREQGEVASEISRECSTYQGEQRGADVFEDENSVIDIVYV